jgi:hypothetical protein
MKESVKEDAVSRRLTKLTCDERVLPIHALCQPLCPSFLPSGNGKKLGHVGVDVLGNSARGRLAHVGFESCI